MTAMYNEVRKRVSKRLKQARQERGLTQQALADELGVVQSNYAHYESGRTLISIDQLVILSRVLDKPISFFIYEIEADLEDLAPSTREALEMMKDLRAEDRRRILDYARYVAHQAKD